MPDIKNAEDDAPPELPSLAELDGQEPVITTYPLTARVKSKRTTRLTPKKTEEDYLIGARQIDTFVAQMLCSSIKDDRSSMNAPIFSLSTKPDMDTWRWTSGNGRNWVEVRPSSIGRATMHDKDFLIYITSVIVAEMDKCLKAGEPMPGRKVEIKLADFMKTTGRDRSGHSYDNFEMMMDRLKGTTLKTNIARSEIDDVRAAFGLIETYEYGTTNQPDGTYIVNQSTPVRVVISEWLYRALQEREVLTLHSDYWTLRKPLQKRLYEIARAHVGTKQKQDTYRVSDATLHKDTSSLATLRRFRSMMTDIINTPQPIPEYDIGEATMADGGKGYVFSRRNVLTMLPLKQRSASPRQPK